MGKKVIVIAQRGNVKQKLKQLADEFYFVDELPKLVVDNAQPQTTSTQSQISYEDATKYLIESITILRDKGKASVISSVNNLMCQNKNFPNYQGVASILKPDGKTFSQFGKFVDAVVKEGKIRRQNQEVFLVEVEQLAT